MKRSKKQKIFYLIITFAIVFLAVIGLHFFSEKHYKKTFICHWYRLFNDYSSNESSYKWAESDRPSLIYKRVFADGTWIMLRSQTIAGGSSFDATVSLDSNGKIYWTDYAFSGFEGLGEVISRISASSITDFYNNAKTIKLRNVKDICH